VNKLMTWDFWSICSAAALLHLALFLWLPLLPYILSQGWGLSASAFAPLYLIYLIGILLVGPFHAWLADVFRRKYILMLPLLLLTVFPYGCLAASEMWQLQALMLGAGCCHGLACSAGITISIDIVESERRSKANKVYALVVSLGAMLGIGLGSWLSERLGFYGLAHVMLGLLLLALCLVAGIYVAFRAPIGVPRCSSDRFFLPRTWLLAIQMLLFGGIAGLLLPLAHTPEAYLPVGALLLLLLPLRTFVTAFVKMSHHCQRATSVHSCLLSLLAGMLVGTAISFCLADGAASQIAALVLFGVSLVLLPFSRKFFQKYRVRM